MRVFRRPIACLLCVALTWDLGTPIVLFFNTALAHAEATQAIPAQQAVKYLEDLDFFKNKEDPLRSYVYDASNNRLTSMGEIIYAYYSLGKKPAEIERLKQDPARKKEWEVFEEEAKRRVKEHQQTLNDLRQTGPLTDRKWEAAQKLVTDVHKLLPATHGSSGIDLLTTLTRLSAFYSGAAMRDPMSQVYLRQPAADSGTLFYNQQGELVYRTDKDGVIVYSEDLAKRQKQMNKARSTDFSSIDGCTHNVPVTGRYNYETLNFSRCLLESQTQRLEKNYRLQRVLYMAQLLGKMYADHQLDSDDKVQAIEKRLETQVIRSGFAYGDYVGFLDKPTPVAEIVDKNLAKFKEHLEESKKYLRLYRDKIQKYLGKDTITPKDVEALAAQESMVKRFITLARLEALSLDSQMKMESLSWEFVPGADGGSVARRVKLSPDSKRIRDAIEDGPYAPEKKRELHGQSRQVAMRFLQVHQALGKIKKKLEEAPPDADLAATSVAMNATEQELQNASLMYAAYLSAIQLYKVTTDENASLLSGLKNLGVYLPNQISKIWGGDLWGQHREGNFVPWFTRQGAELINGLSNAIGGWDWAGDYLRRRETLDKYQPRLGEAVHLISQGNFQGAVHVVATMDDSAWQTHMPMAMGSTREDVTSQMKFSAILAKAQDIAMRVAKTHIYTGIAVDLVLWSGALALAAPLVSANRLFSLSKVCSQTGALAERAKLAGAVAPRATFFREWADNIRGHFSQLYGAEEKLRSPWAWLRSAESLGVRFVRTGFKLGNFTWIAGLLGGGLGWLGHNTWNSKDSQFENNSDAIWDSMAYSARWTVQAWHPLILFMTVPYTAYQGMPGTYRAMEHVASRGILTGIPGVHKGADWFTAFFDRASRSTSSWAPVAKIGGGIWQVAVTADHFAKFMALGHLAEYAGHHMSRRMNLDEETNEVRGIKRSVAAGHYWMEAPLWLLLPMPPARLHGAADAFRRSAEGMRQYEAAGKLPEILNAGHMEMGDPLTLPLLRPMRRSLLEVLLSPLRWREPDSPNTFQVTSEQYLQALRVELPLQVRKRLGVDPDMDPTVYFRVAQWEGPFGRIKRVGDEFRQVALELGQQGSLRNLRLAESIVLANPGTSVSVPGSNHTVTATLPLQRQLAEVLYRNHQQVSTGWAKIFKPFRKGGRIQKDALQKSEELLEPYLLTDRKVNERAGVMVDNLLALKQSGKDYSDPLDPFLGFTRKHMCERPAELEALGDSAPYTYRRLIDEAQAEFANIESRLSPAERKFLRSYLDYLEAQYDRFNYFNNEAMVLSNLGESFDALASELSSRNNVSPTVRHELTLIRQEAEGLVRGMTLSQNPLHPNYRVVREGESPDQAGTYLHLVKQVKDSVPSLRQRHQWSQEDTSFFNRGVQAVEGAYCLLKDSSGSSIPGWRGAQFRRVTESVYKWLYSPNPDPRQAIQAPTSAGKTLIIIEHLRRVAKRYGELKGGHEVVYITRSEILKLQFEADVQAMLIGDLGMKVTTGSKYRAKMAEGQFRGKDSSRRKVTITDEGDAFQSETAVSIGEGTEMVPSEHPGYRRLKSIQERMLELLDYGPRQLRGHLLGQLELEEALVGRLPHNQQAQAQALIRQVRKAVIDWTNLLVSAERTPSLRPQDAVARADNLLQKSQGRHARQDFAGEIQELDRALTELRAVGADAAQLRRCVDAVDAAVQRLELARARRRLDHLMDRHQSLLGQHAGPEWAEILVAHQDMARALTVSPESFGQAPAQGFRAFLEAVGFARDPRAALQHQLLRLSRSQGRLLRASPLPEGDVAAAREARQELHRINIELQGEIKGMQPGWQGRVRRLLAEREPCLDRAVSSENPIYQAHLQAYQEVLAESGPLQAYADTLQNLSGHVVPGSSVADQLMAMSHRLRTEVRNMGPNWRHRVRQLLEESQELVEHAFNRSGPRYQEFCEAYREATRPEYEFLAHEKSPMAQMMYRQRIQDVPDAVEALLLHHAGTAAPDQAEAFRSVAQALRRFTSEGSTLRGHSTLWQARRQIYERFLQERQELHELQQQYQVSGHGRKVLLEGKLREARQRVERLGADLAAQDRTLGELALEQRDRAAARPQFEASARAWRWLDGFHDPVGVQALRQSKRALAEIMMEGRRELGQAEQRTDAQAAQEIARLRDRVNRIEADIQEINGQLEQLQARSMQGMLGQLGMADSALYRVLDHTPHKAKEAFTKHLNDLTAKYTQQWLQHVRSDPFLSPSLRWEMSFTMGFGLSPAPASPWVRHKLVNYAQSRFVDPAEVTYYRGKAAPKVSGEIQLNLETEWRDGKRLEGRNDISLKEIRHEAVSQSKQVAEGATFTLSGTDPATLRRFQLAKGYDYVGEGNPGLAPMKLKVFSSRAEMLKWVSQTVKGAVVDPQGDALVALVAPNTPELKRLHKHLRGGGTVNQGQISSVFSDVVFLRLNRPEANVDRQQNIEAMRRGAAKELGLDGTYASRGLTFPLRGGEGGFGGYRKPHMVLMNTFEMTLADVIQSQGRFGGGRLLKGVVPEFTQVFDMPSALRKPEFVQMVMDHPTFRMLRENPPTALQARLGGRRAEWADIHAYIETLPADSALSKSYHRAIEHTINKIQGGVELRRFEFSGLLERASPQTPLGLSAAHGAYFRSLGL